MYPALVTLKKAHPETKRDVELNCLECDIIFWLAQDCTIKEVGKHLCLAYDTIHHRIDDLYEKTNLHTHAGLVSFAFRIGLLKTENGKVVKAITEPVVIEGWGM